MKRSDGAGVGGLTHGPKAVAGVAIGRSDARPRQDVVEWVDQQLPPGIAERLTLVGRSALGLCEGAQRLRPRQAAFGATVQGLDLAHRRVAAPSVVLELPTHDGEAQQSILIMAVKSRLSALHF